MKILNIYFKNINSIEGESRIHFDQAPIVDGGVFAITGPNGSGKSSILDAITLGLYGETYRFDRPAEHVMTKLTTDSFAEVEFALGDNKYRASWRVARTDDSPTGEMLAPEMKLVQLNGREQVLEQSVQKVREKMFELTGMDFHKFSKSIVLAQGDFAAFLNALDSERMDILEKISGSDIYANYKQQAEQKYNQSQARLQQLEQDLATMPVMNEVTLEASQHDLEDFKEQQIELKTELDEVERLLNWVQGISRLEKQNESLVKEQKQLSVQVEENQQKLDEITAAKDVLAFEDDLASIDNKSEALQQSKKTLDSFRHEVEMLQQQLKAVHFDEKKSVNSRSVSEQKETLDQLSLKLTDLKLSLPKESELLNSLEQQKEQKITALSQAETWLQANKADKSLIDNFPEITKLGELRQDLIEIQAKQTANSKWSKRTKIALDNKKAELKSVEQKLKQLKSGITENEDLIKTLSEDRSFEELKELQVDQQQRVFDYRELYDLATVNEKLSRKGFFGQLFGSNEEKEEAELEKEYDLLQLEIGREKKLIATLELAVKNEALLKKMAADRDSLVDGKACPLCGALKHPYSEHLPAPTNSTKVLKEQRKVIKTLLTDEVSLNKQIVLAKKQIVSNEQKDDKLKNVRAQWNALANRLNAYGFDLTIDNLSLMKDLVKAEKKELNDIANLIKKTSKLQLSITGSKETVIIYQTALERNTKELEGLTEEWEGRPKDLDDIEKAYTEMVEQEKKLSEQIENQLVLVGEKMPKKAKEKSFFKRLSDRKQQYKTQAQSAVRLAEEIKQLEQEIKDSSEKVNTLNQAIQQYAEEMQQEESAGMHLSLIEKQKLMADKEVSFAAQETELDSLKQQLIDKIKETSVTDLSALRALLVVIHQQGELQQQQQALQEKTESLNGKQIQLKAQLDAEQAQVITEQTEYDLSGKQSAVKRKLDIAKQEVASLQNKLDKQTGFQQKQQDLVAKIAQQKTELADCEAEMNLVSSETNLEFRRKVQNIISDQLMTQANQVLEKISGRYYVRKAVSEHGLALEIEDTKQKNVRRLPKTLSGGESFIVSLALALGLSEMSNNGHAVDSLFLDEGFGNLDAESLYLAMTALESLQTHGKVVGVISHVEGVKNRIKTQIEMIKKPNGLCALKMVS